MKIRLGKKTVNDLESWFSDYVGAFRYQCKELQQNINLKIEHTGRVKKEIISIGTQLGLDKNELNLAEIIALFHDLGRFEQYDRYKTFSDRKSEDHAELGIRILKKYNVLDSLDDTLKEIVFCSVKNHNKAFVPENETDGCLFYSRLVRDADKLDIYRVVTSYYLRNDLQHNSVLELGLPDTPGISKEIYDMLLAGTIVDSKYVKNLNDMKLLQAGWIYDLNFRPTVEFIKERGYIELLRKALPDTNEIKNIFDSINLHIQKSYN